MPNSPWSSTSSGGSSSAPSSTPLAPSLVVAQQNSASYMTNYDKIELLAQWNAELAAQTTLDAQAVSAGVSHTTYDNAVSNISTQLIIIGAPSNWATVWPDGTTSGPWTNVKTSLSALWVTINTARVNLQNSIAAAGAAAAQSAAISAAATDATSKAASAILQAQLHSVAFSSSSLPALPSSSYPAGYSCQTTDNRKWQVNAAGTAWGELLQAAVGIFGQVVAAQLTVTNFTNLIPNPNSLITNPPSGSYEAAGLTNWGALFPGVIGSALTPNGWGRVIAVPSPGGNVFYRLNMVPCKPGDVFSATCQAATCNGNGNVWLGLSFLAGDGVTDVGDYYSAGMPINYSFTAPNNASVKAAAPAGAAYAEAFIQIYNPSTPNSVVLFNNFMMRLCIPAQVIVDGALTAQQANVNMAMTSNFATDTGQTAASLTGTTGVPSGNPTAGAWMGVGSAQPILVGPGGMKVGVPLYGGTYSSYNVDAAAVLGYNIARTNYVASSPPANPRFWYGGNIDLGTNGGAPNIVQMTATPTVWDTTERTMWLDLALAPSSASDNFDGMQYATIQLYRQSAAGTTATLTAVGPLFKVALPDRLYQTAGTDGNSGNVATVTALINHTGISGGVPAAIITLYNCFGPSASHCFYSASGWGAGTALIDNGVGFPSGITGGGSGGTGGGSGSGHGCVPAGTMLLLADGLSIPIEWASLGMMVAAWDDVNMEPTTATIVKTFVFKDRALWRIRAMDQEIVCSHDHRLWNGSRWVPARELVSGQETVLRLPDGSLQFGAITKAKPTGELATVFHVGLDKGHLFCAGGFLAHNMKPN